MLIDIIILINIIYIDHMMIKKEPVMTLRKNLGEILNGVEYKHDSVIITRAGKSSAAIIDMCLFEKIRRMKSQFENLTTELQDAFAPISGDEKYDLVNEAVRAVRNK